MAENSGGPPIKGAGERQKGAYSCAWWLKKIDEATDAEKDWRELGKKIVKRYRDDRDNDAEQNRYNILYANTEVLRGVLYQQPPKPDVRRRFLDEDPLARVVSDVLYRSLSYTIDESDLDTRLRQGVDDLLLPGRGVVRVRYKADIADEEVVDETVRFEYVPWEMFRMSPVSRWEKVWWIAYGEMLTREELKMQFGDELGSQVNLDHKPADDSDEGRKQDKARALVWTVWCKRTKRVYVLSSGYPDKCLREDEDPLRLKNFFPCPMPMTGIRTNDCLTPVPLYLQYEDQAEEMDRVNDRISHLVEMLKVRGVYDPQMSELERILKADDGEMIPVQNYSALLDKGGLTAVIATVDIKEIAGVVKELYAQREQIKQTIYEVMGISDIVRGASQAQETATAQQIKSNYAGIRIKAEQKAIQVFARDLLRLTAEIIAEHFEPQTLMAMTNIQLPTAQEKQAAIQAGKPPDPRPTWEDVIQILRSEQMRSFRVDIETDSTVALDKESERKQVGDIVNGLGTLLQSLTPAVEGGLMTAQAGMAIFKASVRRFDFGKDVEEAMERDQMNPPQPKQEDDGTAAEAAKAQAMMQAEQLKAQTTKEVTQMNVEKDLQINREKLEAERQMKITEAFGTLQVPAADGNMVSPMEFIAQFGQLVMQHGLAMGQQAAAMEKMMMALDITLQRMEAQNMALIQSIQTPKVVQRAPDGRITAILPANTTVQ